MIVYVVSQARGSSVRDAAVAPELVQAGEGQRATVGAVDEERLLARLALGVLAVGLTCHSYQPSAAPAARREAAALANADFSSTDSARALIIRSPTLTSLAQDGTSPQVSRRSWRTGGASSSYDGSVDRGARVRTTGACLVGATL